MRNKRPREQVTLQIFQQLANSMHPWLQFTGEAANDKEGIPVLDTSMKLGRMMFPGPLFKEEANVIPPGERKQDWEG